MLQRLKSTFLRVGVLGSILVLPVVVVGSPWLADREFPSFVNVKCAEMPSHKSPLVYTIKVRQGERLRIEGLCESPSISTNNNRIAVVFVQFFDDEQNKLKTDAIPFSKSFKCPYFHITTGPKPVKFFKELSVPQNASYVEIRVSRFRFDAPMVLTDFRCTVHDPGKWVFRMQLVSVWFLVFCGCVCLLYFCLPWIQPYVLLAASCAFYSCFGGVSFAFIGASAASIWIGGLAIGRMQRGGDWLLGAVVVFNVGIMVMLKYVHPWSSVVVPLGISFYSLQAISYVWDVKRGTIPAERNPLKLALYLIFFPTVMQGPISRYGQLGVQLWTRHSYSWDMMQSGLELALWGYFKKMVIADRAAMLADAVFAPGATMEGFPVVLGVVCYSIQIYADFSGCVDICRGICEVMGINLIENFKHPYFATSIKDFWRRWHIALSSWLKDYVYIPLGGNRYGALRKNLNVLIVFGVSGVWHGVGINFFIWGLLHGVYQVFDALTGGIRKRIVALCQLDENAFSFRFGQRIWTFALVTFAWIFFRAPTLADAWSVIKRMCVFNPWTLTDGSYLKHGLDAKDLDVLVLSLVVLLVVSIMQDQFKVREWLARQMLWFRWLICLCAVFGTIIFGIYGPGYNASQFIYMQF